MARWQQIAGVSAVLLFSLVAWEVCAFEYNYSLPSTSIALAMETACPKAFTLGMWISHFLNPLYYVKDYAGAVIRLLRPLMENFILAKFIQGFTFALNEHGFFCMLFIFTLILASLHKQQTQQARNSTSGPSSQTDNIHYMNDSDSDADEFLDNRRFRLLAD